VFCLMKQESYGYLYAENENDLSSCGLGRAGSLRDVAGCLKGIRHLKDKGLLNNIDMIGLSGHMNGMIPVDAQGEPVYNEIIHSDNRSEQYCSFILDRISIDNFFATTGNRIDSYFTLPKIIRFKQHLPSLYKKTKYIIQSKDFIRSKLTGVNGVTDYSDASLTGAFNFKKKMWAKDILYELGIDINKFPQFELLMN